MGIHTIRRKDILWYMHSIGTGHRLKMKLLQAIWIYCLNTFCGCNIMYCLCIGSIFAIISCYYKIKGIKEIEKKKEINDIELEDVDKE